MIWLNELHFGIFWSLIVETKTNSNLSHGATFFYRSSVLRFNNIEMKKKKMSQRQIGRRYFLLPITWIVLWFNEMKNCVKLSRKRNRIAYAFINHLRYKMHKNIHTLPQVVLTTSGWKEFLVCVFSMSMFVSSIC